MSGTTSKGNPIAHACRCEVCGAEIVTVAVARLERLEKLLSVLIYISKEREDFWPYTSEKERALAQQLQDEQED